MKKLAAVIVICVGCKMAECQNIDTTARLVIGGKSNEAGLAIGKAPMAGFGKVNFDGGMVARGAGAGVVNGGGVGDTIREISITTGWGSKADTVPKFDWNQKLPAWKQPFPLQSFVLPAAMIAYGAMAVKNGTLQNFNGEVKEGIWENNPHRKTTIDNFMMFTPTIAVYGLNALGIHGQHNFKDRTMIWLMANVFTQGVVFSTKGWTHEMRPDGSDRLSFPSGHTAEAFMAAEFMRQEYKDVSAWYGVAGYALAATTGMLRMYNNKHWMSDVVAGAGVGIASTRMAYWLYPKMKHWFGKKDAGENAPVTMLMPTYQNGSVGLSYIKTFK